MKKSNNDRIMKFAQGCDSLACKKKYKDTLDYADQCPATPHDLNFTTKIITCVLCGKETKYKGKNT